MFGKTKGPKRKQGALLRQCTGKGLQQGCLRRLRGSTTENSPLPELLSRVTAASTLELALSDAV